VHRARQIAVAAERHHERHAIANRLAPGRHDRQAAGEADADDADLAVGLELRLLAGPADRVLDHVGDRGRNLETLEVWSRYRQHAEPGRSQVFSQADQARLVDAIAMHAWDQDDSTAGLPGRAEEPRRHVARARRHGDLSIAREWRRAPRRHRGRGAGQIGGADDEAQCVEVGKRDEVEKAGEQDQEDRRSAATRQRHARMVH